MPIEIERKFLVISDGWRQQATHSRAFTQGYFESGAAASVRVRLSEDEAWLNIKSAQLGRKRLEFEYPIPFVDAQAMLEQFCAARCVSKLRYWVPVASHIWEVDVFDGANAGLVVAEVELQTEDETFVRPDWLGREVTDERRYYNLALAEHPYRDWARES